MLISGLVARGAPTFPRFLIYTKATLILLSTIVLSLASYALSIQNSTSHYDFGAPEYLVFLAVFTWLVYGVPLAIELEAPRFYYRIVALGAFSLNSIFWLTGWAWSAYWASYSLSYDDSSEESREHELSATFGSVMGACAGLGALIWILSLAELGFFCHFALKSYDPVYLDNARTEQARLPRYEVQTPGPSQRSYTMQTLDGGKPRFS
ncbi:hypothetical protein F5Y11DRAFT_366758 [Daldinia sp. FL1419]|nr:hypothetical protein F5Y11DRAFT_366758 [Daldinia sp. FL1419]